MTSQEFVDILKDVVISDSVKSVDAKLNKPAGRSPSPDLIVLSEWYNKLDSKDKDIVMTIVKKAVEITTFSFLCVLDGVRAIEGQGEKGRLNLYYEKDDKNVLLNNPNDDYLHDLL